MADEDGPATSTGGAKPRAPRPVPHSHQGAKEKVVVLGYGNFGTCLADHLADLGNEVVMWGRDRAVVDSINEKHLNSKYLGDYLLSDNLKATTELSDELMASATVILSSIPTQVMRKVLTDVKPKIRPEHLLIFVNKGIEGGTCLLPNEIVKEVLGEEYARNATFLSGPSFAVEVVQRFPTAVSVASENYKRAVWCQTLFHAPHFRVYTTRDTIGVEITGALKNVVAIGSGTATGLGFQSNTRAMLITRGLAEITRVGLKLGADPLTFAGLSGVGDLSLTCSSDKSRNFTVGFRLGKGEKLEDIIKSLGSVAEGVETTRAAKDLVARLDVDGGELTRYLDSVLFEGLPLKEGMKMLLTRQPKHELMGIVAEEFDDERERRLSLVPTTAIEAALGQMKETEY
ncbi:6-phosphogluconate dehydrogenase [Hyaloraphidium curvatum]|nr:6-phosphogluconate dehydrogenase [Hyaloraphidium curvatum]